MLMESYKEMYLKAKKAKVTESLTPKYHDWKTDGNLVVGAFVSFAPVEGTMGGKSYNQYIFDTDEGLVKFSLGSAADNEVCALFMQGVVYAIEYQGKEEIKGGRQVNKFDIDRVNFSDDVIEPEKPVKDDGPANDKK